MIKKEVVYKIIAENEDAINSNDFNVLYDELGNNLDFEDADSAGYLTKLLLEVGADPLKYINYMPGGYFCGLPIKSFTVPNHITELYDGVFMGCSDLESVTLHDSIRVFGDSCFERCKKLKEITIPQGVTTLSQSLFYECTNLSKINMNNHIKYIEDYAFSGTALTELNLTNVDNINMGAFEETPNLHTIYIGKNTKQVSSRVEITGLYSIIYDGTKEEFKHIMFTNALGLYRKILVKCSDGEIYC